MGNLYGDILIPNEFTVLENLYRANMFPMYYPSTFSFEYNSFYEFKGNVFLPVMIHLWSPIEGPYTEVPEHQTNCFYTFTELQLLRENTTGIDCGSFAISQAKDLNRQLFDFLDEWLISEPLMRQVRFCSRDVIEAEDLYLVEYYDQSEIFQDREVFWGNDLAHLLQDRRDWWDLYDQLKRERGYLD